MEATKKAARSVISEPLKNTNNAPRQGRNCDPPAKETLGPSSRRRAPTLEPIYGADGASASRTKRPHFTAAVQRPELVGIPRWCGSGSLVHNADGNVLDIRPTGCGCWHCEICGPIRNARCALLAQRGKPTTLLTLTCKPRAGETPLTRRRKMAEALPLLLGRMARYLKVERISYFAINEKTKAGEPHLHLLLRLYDDIPLWLLKHWWRKLTGWNNGAHVRAVDDVEKAASYVTKHLGDPLHRFGHFKRYWMTRHWVLPPDDGKKWTPRKWTHIRETPAEAAYALWQDGWRPVPGEVEPRTRRYIGPEWATGPPLHPSRPNS